MKIFLAQVKEDGLDASVFVLYLYCICIVFVLYLCRICTVFVLYFCCICAVQSKRMVRMHQYQFVAAAASPETDDLASSEILSIKRIQYPNWLPAKLTPY